MRSVLDERRLLDGSISIVDCCYDTGSRDWFEEVRCLADIRYPFVLLIGLAGCAVSTASSSDYAQGKANKCNSHFYWVDGGLGVNSSLRVASAGLSVSYQTGRHLLSLSYVFCDENELFGWSQSEKVWNIGILYGRGAEASYGLASISGGLGMVGGNLRREGYAAFRTIGIPVEGQLFLRPLSFLGIGIYGFSNLNPKKSFVGAVLCIQIGKLK